jgi:hypothetical protein
MMTLIAAAALAAQVPAAPSNPPMMQMGAASQHEMMDCCNECCKHMGKSDDRAQHGEHNRR